MDPSRYAVAEAADRYVGLVRVVARRRHARIGLVAVRDGLHERRLVERVGQPDVRTRPAGLER
jgi:hypothetical protein